MIASAARIAGPDGQAQRDSADLAGQPRGQGRRSWRRGQLALLAVLALQTLLSLRLTWSNTAFQDEALYLWAGHLQWANWLHGVPIAPAFPSYFSGAPVIYPPIGALADSIGGLTGARLTSLCFMLGATALLWSATRRLFDERAALCASAVFAATAATQFLGALATYDAMALLLLAAAAWCAIRAGECRRHSMVALTAAVAALLVLANATKYASVLWDPVVLALAAFAQVRYRGRKAGFATAAAVAAAVAVTLTVAVLLASRAYWDGIKFSTLERSGGGWSSLAVFQASGAWIGLLAALAIAGAVLLTRSGRDRTHRLTGWVLATAVLLAPAEQARIHTTVSLFKHVGYGGWFGAIMAGYAIAALTRLAAGRSRPAAVLAAAAALIATAAVGAVEASHHFASWPNSAALIARLRPLVAEAPGPSLAENPFTPSYYLSQSAGTSRPAGAGSQSASTGLPVSSGPPGGGQPATAWVSTWYFAYIDPVTGIQLTGIPAYADAIRRDYFKVVVIGFTSTPGMDAAIERDLALNGRYHVVASVPWFAGQLRGHYLIWRYQPPKAAVPAVRSVHRVYSPGAHETLGLPPKLGG